MNTSKAYLAGTIGIVLAVLMASCSKSFYTNANENPIAPASVTPASLLTNIEVSLGFAQGGDGARFTGLFTQQITGIAQYPASYYNYVVAPTDPEYYWDNMYTSVMENDTTLMALANAAGNTEYYAISHILMAYTLQCNVDWWGSIPYSQALKGSGTLQPAYDADRVVYGNVLSLLNLGMTELNSSNIGSAIPTNDDIIYQGNAASWYCFALAIKARLYFHQCKLGAAFSDSAIANATKALNQGFSIAQVHFGASSTNCNPLSQFNSQWGGITYKSSTLIDSLLSWNDRRASVYDTTGSQAGYYGSCTSPVEFFTVEELYFVIAECTLRNSGGVTAAQSAYTNAITANYAKLGLGSYLSAYLAGPQGTLNPNPALALVQVQQQKWAALYLNQECWASFRLSFSLSQPLGVPPLQPQGSGIEVPRRMIYPLSETTLNPNNYNTSATLYQPQVFWDTYPN